MQRNEFIKKLEEVGKYTRDSAIIIKTFSTVVKKFRLAQVNKILDKGKVKGVAGRNIFEVLMTLCFVDIKNIHQLMHSGYGKDLSNKKDVYYDFLRNPCLDWRAVLYSFVGQFIRISKKNGDHTTISGPKCLIVDDSMLSKTGKAIELIGKLYDHCSHRYQLGLRMLTLGFWDGRSFVPVNFSIHNEPGKNKNRGMSPKQLKAQYSKERNVSSHGYQRQQEVGLDKVEMSIKMIQAAIKKGLDPLYVLSDSWFICERFISGVQNIKTKHIKKLSVIGLMKTNRNLVIDSKTIKAALVPESKRNQIRYCKALKCNYIALKIEYKGVLMKAFWVKPKGQQSWKMLVCTDTSLSFMQVMKYYQIRWSIETFFKECKQNLNLNGCQSKDFDAHIAHITLCFITYTVLSLRKRFDDYESMGELFKGMKSELLESNLVEKIWTLLIELYCAVLVELGVDWEAFLELCIENQMLIDNMIKANIQFLNRDYKNVA